jgi:hypothetical protein
MMSARIAPSPAVFRYSAHQASVTLLPLHDPEQHDRLLPLEGVKRYMAVTALGRQPLPMPWPRPGRLRLIFPAVALLLLSQQVTFAEPAKPATPPNSAGSTGMSSAAAPGHAANGAKQLSSRKTRPAAKKMPKTAAPANSARAGPAPPAEAQQTAVPDIPTPRGPLPLETRFLPATTVGGAAPAAGPENNTKPATNPPTASPHG